MKPLRVTSARYDLGGHPIRRVLIQALLNRVLPFGWFGGGPNIRYGLELWGRHALGNPVAALWLRIEPLAAAYRRRARRVGRLAGRPPLRTRG